MPATAYPRTFLPADFIPTTWQDIAPIFEDLMSRTITTKGELESFLLEISEVEAVIGEHAARIYIKKDLDTTDVEAAEAWQAWLTGVQPKLSEANFALQKKWCESPLCDDLDQDEFGQYVKRVRNSVAIFREANLPLSVEESTLATEYGKIVGAQSVTFQGQEYTMQQMRRFQLADDRSLREASWRACEERRAQDYTKLEDLFDKLLALRAKMAANADCESVTELEFKKKNRFDYSPKDCFDFHNAVEKAVVPVARRLKEERRAKLGVATLRPWDLSVDPDKNPPLKPFEEIDDFIAKTHKTFELTSPVLGDYFKELVDNQMLELESRKGKAPGGYQYCHQEIRLPFIFMNAVGMAGDIRTLLHEGGHAFHSLEQRPLRLSANRSGPMEFNETASMSMELVAGSYINETFFTDEEAKRARIELLEGVVSLLAWVATVDAFQHWIYDNVKATRAQRQAAWLGLRARFDGGMDYSGIEESEAKRWIQQLHIFRMPHYYIEYGIAQLGALQVYRNWLNDHEKAIADYRHGLSFGYTRSLPELFELAGIKFDFSEAMVSELMGIVESELSALKG